MKYLIVVTRDTTESTVVDVEAGSVAEAQAKAIEEVNNDLGAFDWTPDDTTGGDPYIADPQAEIECGECLGTGKAGTHAERDCPHCFAGIICPPDEVFPGIAWTSNDQNAAIAHGWCIEQYDSDGMLVIAADDSEIDVFGGEGRDSVAWSHVEAEAAGPSDANYQALCQKALALTAPKD